MSVPYSLPSTQSMQEDPGNRTPETHQRNSGHYEPSYTDLQCQFSPDRQTTHGERSPWPNSHTEIEKPEAHHEEDSLNASSSSSSSVIPDENRTDRPSGIGPTHGLQTMRSVSMVRDGIKSRHEVELGAPLERSPTPRHLADEDLVTWDIDDPENPKTWSFPTRWAAVGTMSIFTFISPVSSSMTAPALDSIAAELNMSSEFEKELSLSIFVLGAFPGRTVT